jgi:integral membrane protein
MKHFFTSRIGRLRLVSFLEGMSLLALVFIAVPVKHAFGDPALVRIIGPVHGLLFLLFIFNTLAVGIEQRWNFRTTTWKVLLACVIPFGTFYIDRKILRNVSPAPET